MTRRPWPDHVVVTWDWYGCETGCEVWRCLDDSGDEILQCAFASDDPTEAEAREVFNIPPEVRVTVRTQAYRLEHGDPCP